MDMQNNNNAMQIVFCKHSDLRLMRGDISFDICTAINKIIPKQVLCAQKLKSVWAICVSGSDAKNILIRRGLTINDRQIELYPENPHAMGSTQTSERVVIKDYPFWEPDSLISEYLKAQQQITSYSVVYQSKARNNITNETSTFRNGDRFVFVNANFYPPLPQQAQIGDYSCRIRHVSQTRNCVRCRSGSHKTYDVNVCPSYVESCDNVVPFVNGIFSNFDKCLVTYDGMTFPTSEHLYQWRACTEALRADLAELVVKATTPREAKLIASKLKHDDLNWHTIKFEVMREVLQAKAASSEKFRDALLQTGDKILVEARVDDVWGSGLTYELTMSTDPYKYPGSNKLGVLLGEVRDALRTAKVDLPNDDDTKSLSEASEAIPMDVTAPSQPSQQPHCSRSVVRVGFQPRASSLSPTRLKELRKSTPLIKDFMNKRMKRKCTSPLSEQPPSTRSRDIEAAGDTVSGEPSNNSFISANDQTVVNDIANMSDVDTDAEPDNT